MTFKTIFGRTAFLAATLALFLTATSEARAACGDGAGTSVDWSGCDKSRADLHRADLHNADLSRAILAGASLFYAYLTNADLSGADLSGATWTDGGVCAEGSWGSCN